MVVLDHVSGHFGSVHFPTVLRAFIILALKGTPINSKGDSFCTLHLVCESFFRPPNLEGKVSLGEPIAFLSEGCKRANRSELDFNFLSGEKWPGFRRKRVKYVYRTPPNCYGQTVPLFPSGTTSQILGTVIALLEDLFTVTDSDFFSWEFWPRSLCITNTDSLVNPLIIIAIKGAPANLGLKIV